MNYMMCLFTPWLSLVLMAPTHGQMDGWVDLGYWLHTGTEVVCPNEAGYSAQY